MDVSQHEGINAKEPLRYYVNYTLLRTHASIFPPPRARRGTLFGPTAPSSSYLLTTYDTYYSVLRTYVCIKYRNPSCLAGTYVLRVPTHAPLLSRTSPSPTHALCPRLTRPAGQRARCTAAHRYVGAMRSQQHRLVYTHLLSLFSLATRSMSEFTPPSYIAAHQHPMLEHCALHRRAYVGAMRSQQHRLVYDAVWRSKQLLQWRLHFQSKPCDLCIIQDSICHSEVVGQQVQC